MVTEISIEEKDMGWMKTQVQKLLENPELINIEEKESDNGQYTMYNVQILVKK